MIADLVYNADLAKYPENKGNSNSNSTCGPAANEYPYPAPPNYPPYPFYGYPYVPPTEPVQLKKSSVEAQICKLSKKAAAIKKMIENFKEKNKDAIIKIGEASYNFGTYYTTSKDEAGQKSEEESVYGELVLSLLTQELAAIKAKMVELTTELDEDDSETEGNSGIESTVT
jgi:hypothetical protein